MEIQEFIEKLKEKMTSEIAWLGGDRNKSIEAISYRKAYSNVIKWIDELSKLHQPTVISAVCEHTKGSCKIVDKKHTMKCDDCGEIIWQTDL